MERFNNILVVVDRHIKHADNAAIIQAAALAKLNHAKLTLMDVVTEPAHTVNTFKGIISSNELMQMIVSQRDHALNDVVTSLRADNIDVTTKVATGTNFIEIIRQVLRGKHDLIIKVASSDDSGFSSSDLHLMRKNPCPIWLLKRTHAGHCKKILAAVDLFQEDNEEGRLLNRFVMDLAVSLAGWKNASLHLLSCWTLYGESALRDGAFVKVSESKLAALLDAEKAAFQQSQDAFSANYNEVMFEKYLIKGDAGSCIPSFVEAHIIDTVVMGTVGRSGVSGLLIGNTAETVLRSIGSSVITVKPFGFESPVGAPATDL